ncbi:MAG: YifB family Mg chelatase-like AAA ATPase [Clostridia bacterium]|nr:YifB family Mg chelatase-like AAA ATPase [Clostridia bacterium]
MVAVTETVELWGLDGFRVSVEADVSMGLARFDVVGLGDTAVREARERVSAAAKNCGYALPVRHITVNLAPADVKKEGSSYDLPILLCILKAVGMINARIDDKCFIGELSLSGRVNGVKGVLPMLLAARRLGMKEVYIPADNAAEASVAEGLTVFAVEHLGQLLAHLAGEELLQPVAFNPVALAEAGPALEDMAYVKGQEKARRAMEIAAAGNHNLLMLGPPGTGKSMLAKCLPGILPSLTSEEALEVLQIYSVAGMLGENALPVTRPFRAPHHTVSAAGIAGGGRIPKPGEITLAHRGVLFLDELPEYPSDTLEVLRQPLEDGTVSVTRVSGKVTYPAEFMLVCAMNPCRCGHYGDPQRKCTCSPQDVRKYLARVSGPLLDRIDIQVELSSLNYSQVSDTQRAESSETVRLRVNEARKRQLARQETTGVCSNAALPASVLRRVCALNGQAEEFMRQAFEKLGLSARGYDRVLRVSRTIADLAGSEEILPIHIAEAVQLRSLDRKYFR